MSRNPGGIDRRLRPCPSRLGLEFDTSDASRCSLFAIKEEPVFCALDSKYVSFKFDSCIDCFAFWPQWWRAREWTRYSQFKGGRIRHMGPRLIRGELIWPQIWNRMNIFTSPKFSNEFPQAYLLSSFLTNCQKKWTIFVPQKPGNMPPLLRCKVL